MHQDAAQQGSFPFAAPEQQARAVAAGSSDDAKSPGHRLQRPSGCNSKASSTADHRAVDVWQLGVTWLCMLCPIGQQEQLIEWLHNFQHQCQQ